MTEFDMSTRCGDIHGAMTCRRENGHEGGHSYTDRYALYVWLGSYYAIHPHNGRPSR